MQVSDLPHERQTQTRTALTVTWAGQRIKSFKYPVGGVVGNSRSLIHDFKSHDTLALAGRQLDNGARWSKGNGIFAQVKQRLPEQEWVAGDNQICAKRGDDKFKVVAPRNGRKVFGHVRQKFPHGNLLRFLKPSLLLHRSKGQQLVDHFG